MIKVLISSKNESVVIKSALALDANVLQAMETGLAIGLQLVLADVQTNWIQSGPRVPGELGPGARLHHRSGVLGKSINTKVERLSDRVRGRTGSVLKYAAIHEFGFHGTMNVRAHPRVTGQFTGDLNWGGQAIDTRRRWMDKEGNFLGYRDTRKAAARSMKKGFVTVQFVRAHTRRVDYAGKPYIRPALERGDLMTPINTEMGKIK